MRNNILIVLSLYSTFAFAVLPEKKALSISLLDKNKTSVKEVNELNKQMDSTSIAVPANNYSIKSRSNIALVEASFPVGFAQCIAGGKHFIGYYDQNKNMVIAQRLLSDTNWKHTVLPTKIGWDSHNYVAMVVDNEGFIHVSGNMHCVNLVYFRSKKPYDSSDFEMVNYMTGKEEDKVTYPQFMKLANGDLLFHYRHGSSGNGYEVYNKWNPLAKTWTRFIDKPMIDGKGLRNAYMRGPEWGPDGYYHLIWVWRESPDCSTNNTFSYARSKDLVHWENVDGQPVSSPLTIDDESLAVDPSPVHTGMLNGVQRIGFDSKHRPVFAYMKYDTEGNSQLFLRKRVKGAWKEQMITNWPYRFNFSGIGSIRFEITLGGMANLGNGEMSVAYFHKQIDSGEIIFNEETLLPVDKRKSVPGYPVILDEVTTSFSQPMFPHIMKSGNYILRWETMGANNDRKPSGKLPAPYMMELIQMERTDSSVVIDVN